MTIRPLRLCGAILLLLVAARSVAAHAKDCLPLTPTGSQGAALLPGGLMNVRHGGTTGAPLHLDVYPHADASVRPLALVLRGGQGTVGQRASYVGQLIELFGDAGYVVATTDYRSGAIDQATADATSALRSLTQCHAATLHVDPHRVVLVAEDSAAPVALKVASALPQLRLGRSMQAPAAPAAVVVVGGRFAGTAAVSVPTLLVHGGADTEVPVTETRAVCREAAVPCEVLEVAGASHRAENWWPSHWSYKTAVLRSLRAHVGRVPAPAWPTGAALRKRIVFDPTHRLALDAWIPAGPGPHAVAVLVHGGGWEAGDRVTYIAPMFGVAASRGMAWVSIDYRLTPDVTVREQVADVRTALAWLRTHAAEMRLDTHRIVLVGESASGQLVAHVAASEPTLAGVVSFYGVYDLAAMAGDPANPRSLARRLLRLTTLDEQGRAALREYSPVHHATRELPPMLLLCGTADRLVDQQRAYVSALQAAGARVDAAEIDGAPHGMEAWHEEPGWRGWEQRVGEWLRARVAGR